MKNRKKKLKLQAKRKITTHIIDNISNMLFYSIKLHYISSTDDYACELFCLIQNKRLSIKGIINPDIMMQDNITIDAPNYMRSSMYNSVTIALEKKDAPEFYELVKSYVYHIGDRLDAGLPHNIDFNFISKIGVNDYQLKKERENFLHVYKIKED